MELLNQPFTGQLGERLIESLNSSKYHTLNIIVAFAKNSGVLRIKKHLEKFRKKGGKINIYVGVDLSGTSYEALTVLLNHTDSLNIVHSEKGQTFHAKIYQFLGKDDDLLIVGSHNLTGGGLWTNFESSIFIPIKTQNNEFKISEAMERYINELVSLKDSFMEISSQEDIENLLQNGYVLKEVAAQVRLARNTSHNDNHERLFGNGTPANLPRLDTKKKVNAPTVSIRDSTSTCSYSLSDTDQIIWFETRRMTGGSRNILDLSMRSLIERGDPKNTSFDLGIPNFMRGGVEFFGLDPTATDQTKNITIDFEGIDYIDNQILFPTGKNANGTWRLQIKGYSPSQQKITDAFKAKGEDYYLVNKIITFTKIQDDYYSMSVYPESEIDNFRKASHILGRNGSTKNAKQLGLLYKPI